MENILSIAIFEKAFDWSVLEAPLNIKWIKKDKQFHNGSIAKMIMLLEEKGYILHPTDKQLAYIFVKGDGSLIDEKNAWKKARANAKKNPNNPILLEIENIIEEFDRRR